MEGTLTRETLLKGLYVLSPADLEPMQNTELAARHGTGCL